MSQNCFSLDMGVAGILWGNTAEEHLKQEQNLEVDRELCGLIKSPSKNKKTILNLSLKYMKCIGLCE